MIRFTQLSGKIFAISFFVIISIVCLSCCEQRSTPKYVVGVSQCSDGLWRQRMNFEMQTEQVLHPEIELRFRQSDDNSLLQCQQIDSFISTLEKLNAPVTEFDEQLWISMVDHVVVHSKEDIRVVYRDGIEK